MPVLSDEDVGLSPSYLSDEDVGLVEDEFAGGETQSPEELARDEKLADEFAALKQERKKGGFAANAAAAIGGAMEVIDPIAVTPQNRLGAFGTAAKGIGHVAGYTGQVGKGIVQDLRLGNITGLPATSQALSTGRAPELEPTSLPARIIEGAGQGIGSMVPAIAATAVGVPPMAAYPTIMGSQAYQETGGDLKATARAALLGAVLPAVSSVAKAAAGKAIVGATRYAPKLAANPVLSKTVEEGASQIAQNAVAGIVEAPELMALYKEDPNKFYDRAAEMIGVNLAMGAHDIMGIANPNARSQSGREIADLIRPKVPEMFSGPRFTPPERGGIPEPVRPITPDATAPILDKPSDVSTAKGTKTVLPADAQKAAESPTPDQARLDELERINYRATVALEKAEQQKAPEVVLNELRSEVSRTVADSIKAEEQAEAKAQDKSKWTKATDTENLKAATPEQRIVAAQKPLDVDSFLKEDMEGYRTVDPEKLTTALEGGHITSGDAASDALLTHFLKRSDLHPLSSIRMLDFTPQDAQMLTGTAAPFHGRFSKKSGQSLAMVEMTMKMQRGEPVTAAQFVETLAHELGHNNITSKFRDAPPEIQRDVTDLFTFVKGRGKGTAFEGHNALTNAHELFAELADPKVREWLASMDYSKNIRKVDVLGTKAAAISPPSIRNSALGRILEIAKKMLKLPDFITDAFGNKVDTITALDQMISLSSRLEKVQRGGGDTQIFTENLSKAKGEPREEFTKAIKDAEKVPNEELIRAKEGPTGLMWDLGAKAKDAGDVAALKTMAEESNAKISALAQEGKIEEAMALAGRQPAEAYEFATGVKLDGTPKWEMFEKRRPGYVPAVPDAKYLAAKGGAAKVAPVAASGSSPGLVAGADTTPSSASGPLKVTAPQQPPQSKLAGPKLNTEFRKAFESKDPQEQADILGEMGYDVNPDNGKFFMEGRDNEKMYLTGEQLADAKREFIRRATPPKEKVGQIPKDSGATEGQMPTVDGAKSQIPTGKESLQVEPSKSQKWTGATEESAKPETGIGGQMLAGIPNPAAVVAGIKKAVADFGPGVKAAGKVVSDAVRDIYKENLNIRKMDDLSRSVLNWSGKLQRSFGEASSAQKEIQRVAKSKVQDEGLTNWMEAGGDKAKLTAWRDGTTDPKLRAGYEAALNLSPAEIQKAQEARLAWDQLFDRAERWGIVDKDPTKPSVFRDDYVTHLWNLGKGMFSGGARTLKDQFKFAKARTFKNYFEGEQAGFKPKTKRLSQIFPIYLHELNSVIAAKQLVKEMWGGKASDGSPLLATRGQATPVSGAKGEAVLVRPEAASPDSKKKGLDISKYKELPGHSALHDWIFIGKDTAGNPVYEKSDLVLHPEAYKKLNAILGKSKIREWYNSEGSATMAIPKVLVKGLDLYQQETKRTMFGLLAPFHQVQEGWHGIGHRILPTPVTGGTSTKAGALKLPKPDLDNPEIYDMAKHGLMVLPDRASEAHFMDGMRHSGLVSFIPGVGRLSDGYSKYLFHEVIPGLKIKTYAAALERNKGVYEKDLASGEVKLEDVKLLTATQVNAAYGHLNYADLGRNPTFQHILQLGLLAPDFLEARGRFFGQALKGLVPELGPKGNRIAGARGNKVGREQLYAMATLAAVQALFAYTAAQLVDGEWDGKHPFEMRKGNRKYTMRSVPEDAVRFAEDIGNVFKGGGEIPFISHRLNPITGRGPLQILTGRDWRQQKVTPQETLKQLAQAPIPLTARGFMGIDKSPLKDWEQLAGAVGLKIMRYSPQNEVGKMFRDWKSKSENPKLVAEAEQDEAQTFAPSIYSDLRQALEKDDWQAGSAAYNKLMETRTPAQVKRAMNPTSVDPSTGASRDKLLPKKLEREFLGSLSEEDREVYEDAKRHRKILYQRFQRLLKGD